LNEEKSIGPFLEAITPMMERWAPCNRWEIIFVNDGSTDATESVIASANRISPQIWGVSLTRNFGHQPAIFTGLKHASGEILAILDADLEDPPEILDKLISAVVTNQADIAYGIRDKREASPLLK
jgi:dolichol-phosphate mannosyltransferase